jgi:hypothetical protein
MNTRVMNDVAATKTRRRPTSQRTGRAGSVFSFLFFSEAKHWLNALFSVDSFYSRYREVLGRVRAQRRLPRRKQSLAVGRRASSRRPSSSEKLIVRGGGGVVEQFRKLFSRYVQEVASTACVKSVAHIDLQNAAAAAWTKELRSVALSCVAKRATTRPIVSNGLDWKGRRAGEQESRGAGIAVETDGSGCSASFCAASGSETTAAALRLATAREK